MNESSKEEPSRPDATVAAQAVLARRSNEQIPLSLGKASLRMRLEAYYSLISPDTLSNRTEWLRKYDQIYEKYGGTYKGERKLAAKLAKKYGTAVRLLLVTDETNRKTTTSATIISNTNDKREESWYKLRPNENGSGVVDFSSPSFDPSAALTRASREDVYRANPWMEGSSILDNLGKCMTLLPENDPLCRDQQRRIQNPKTAVQYLLPTQEPSLSNSKGNETRKRPRNNSHPFDTIASHLDSGPHSVLLRLKEQRKRVTVVIRYVNMIRGTLSGTLIAFDKHMNMILKDVEEVYSPRLANEDHSKSNLELELERLRRVKDLNEEGKCRDVSSSIFVESGEHLTSQPGTWNVRRRQMKQLLVRGDMVVSIYEAAKENRAITKSRYSRQKKTTTNDGRISGANIAAAK